MRAEIQAGSCPHSGNLVLSVSGSGELVPNAEVELGFQDKGELVELNVHVGDQVQHG